MSEQQFDNFSDIDNYFEHDPDWHEEALDTFNDNLMLTDFFELDVGSEISNYGSGGVNLVCLAKRSFENEDGDLCYQQVLNIQFQADSSPVFEFTYAVFTSEEMQSEGEGRFKYWVSAKFSDEANNHLPWMNDYFAEFAEDLTAI